VKQVVPAANLQYFDGGHFVLDEAGARDPEPVKPWRTFLENHKEAIAAIWTSAPYPRSLSGPLLLLRHRPRSPAYPAFNITKHPTSGWIIQQLREAFPFGAAPGFLIHDGDAKYGTEVPAAIRSTKIDAVHTSFESPWQNGVAERWREAAAASCSTMGLLSTSGTGSGVLPSTSPTIMKTAPILDWARKRRVQNSTICRYAPPSRCGAHGSAVAGIRGRARHPKDRLVKCKLKVSAWARKKGATLGA
jgi:hypothetical protein